MKRKRRLGGNGPRPRARLRAHSGSCSLWLESRDAAAPLHAPIRSLRRILRGGGTFARSPACLSASVSVCSVGVDVDARRRVAARELVRAHERRVRRIASRHGRPVPARRVQALAIRRALVRLVPAQEPVAVVVCGGGSGSYGGPAPLAPPSRRLPRACLAPLPAAPAPSPSPKLYSASMRLRSVS